MRHIFMGQGIRSPADIEFSVVNIHAITAHALFPALHNYANVLRFTATNDDVFMAHIRELLLSGVFNNFRNAIDFELVNSVGAINNNGLMDHFVRARLLLNFIIRLKELWDMEAQIVTANDLPALINLQQFFDNNRFVNNNLCHWDLFVNSLADLNLLLADNNELK